MNSELTLDTKQFTLKYEDLYESAQSSRRYRDGLIVSVSDKQNEGIGEITPLPGRTETLDEAKESISQRKNSNTLLSSNQTETPATDFAISTALIDLNAKKHDQSLLNGASLHDQIAVNGLIQRKPTAQTVAVAEKLVKNGFECLKMKVNFDDLKNDLERVRAIRQTLGAEIKIRLDANESWTPELVEHKTDLLSELTLDYVEQPFSKSDLESHVKYRSLFNVAIDEGLLVNPLTDIIQRSAADHVIIKPSCLGSIETVRKRTNYALEHHVIPIFTTTLAGPIEQCIIAHLIDSLGVEKKHHGLFSAHEINCLNRGNMSDINPKYTIETRTLNKKQTHDIYS